MKKSLKHLPSYKRKDLTAIVEAIRATVEVEMIILFGSYARGDFVHRSIRFEFDTMTEFRSDFDILVIVANKKVLHGIRLESRLSTHVGNLLLTAPVSLITHTINEVNHQLTEGQYFFSDIKKEGIMLYDSRRHTLARRGKLKPKLHRQLAEADYKNWYKSANEFYASHLFSVGRRQNKIAAFLLHQATERYFTAITLVFTRYKPRTHDLETLEKRVVMCRPEFRAAFPRTTKEETKCFDLLRRAYIEARYNPKYRITKKQLGYLAKRVRKLRLLTRTLCRERIAAFTEDTV